MSDDCEAVVRELRRAGLAGLTGLELYQRTGCLGYRQRASEARKAGHKIECVHERMTERGKRVSRYRLVEG